MFRFHLIFSTTNNDQVYTDEKRVKERKHNKVHEWIYEDHEEDNWKLNLMEVVLRWSNQTTKEWLRMQAWYARPRWRRLGTLGLPYGVGLEENNLGFAEEWFVLKEWR